MGATINFFSDLARNYDDAIKKGTDIVDAYKNAKDMTEVISY